MQNAITVAATPAALITSSNELPAGLTICTADGFMYEVLPPGVRDYSVRTAGGSKLRVVDIGLTTVAAYGATFSGDESALAQKMLDELNVLRSPEDRILTLKNLRLPTGAIIDVKGTLKLPDGCEDYDRLLHAVGSKNLKIDIKEIDGNAAGQSGGFGTHLIYLVECDSAEVTIDYAHDHYISLSPVKLPDPNDEGRNSSTGAIWLRKCSRAKVLVMLLDGWSREGVYLEECTDSSVWLGHAQGRLYLEYSGLQVSGTRNKILHASVDNAGASSVGFDTIGGTASDIVSTGNRFKSGLNLGHPRFPASRSIIENLVVDGAWNHGISVAAGSEDITFRNISVSDSGEVGFQASDGVKDVRVNGGIISGSGRYNLVAGGAEVTLSNTRSGYLDNLSLLINSAVGLFEDGEVVTGNTSGATASIRRALTSRISATASASQRLLLTNVRGTFVSGETVTGTWGATGTIISVITPIQKLEQGGGAVLEE